MADFEILENPFTPTFGEIPLHLAGRGTLLNELKRAYSGKKRHPSLTMAITGARGTGKTALLAAAADEAEAAGWIAARATALPGMLDDILISTQREGSHLIDSPSAHLSSIEMGGAFSASWENPHRPTNWRNEITHLLNQLRDSETGLLFVIDEVQPQLPEMIQLAAVYQLLVTEGHKVALLMAGLPNNILSLEKDKQVSFLRRSQKRRLARISNVEVEQAIRRTIEENGRSVSDEALQKMTKAANGFPFMIQLVGFHVWEASSSQEIDLQAACSGIKIAESELLENIVKVTYSELSKGDRAYLEAMLQLDIPHNSDIATKLGKTNSYALQYKNRLMSQGVIEEDFDGALSFQMPLMETFLKELSGQKRKYMARINTHRER